MINYTFLLLDSSIFVLYVGDKISYDKKFKYYIHNKLKIGENVDAY